MVPWRGAQSSRFTDRPLPTPFDQTAGKSKTTAGAKIIHSQTVSFHETVAGRAQVAKLE